MTRCTFVENGRRCVLDETHGGETNVCHKLELIETVIARTKLVGTLVEVLSTPGPVWRRAEAFADALYACFTPLPVSDLPEPPKDGAAEGSGTYKPPTLADFVVGWINLISRYDVVLSGDEAIERTRSPEFEEYARANGGLFLPGWRCSACGTYTGLARR